MTSIHFSLKIVFRYGMIKIREFFCRVFLSVRDGFSLQKNDRCFLMLFGLYDRVILSVPNDRKMIRNMTVSKRVRNPSSFHI